MAAIEDVESALAKAEEDTTLVDEALEDAAKAAAKAAFAAVEQAERDEEEAEDDAKAEPEAEDASEMTAEQRAAVDRAVAERILPSVYRHLSAVDSGGGHSQMDTEVDGKGVRQPIALAIVKLLQVLPQTMLQTLMCHPAK